MQEFLNAYSIVWLSVGVAGFIICCGIHLIVKTARRFE